MVLWFFVFSVKEQPIRFFHEALNLASVQRLPVVFICENNLWALSAPFAETTAGSVTNRASAYAIHGEKVDGNDVQAV